ncbi:hypothetical protein CVT25_007757 [Psilocybe cyanescens]|uniref:Protein F37C4.5 n=1 Tax=Psilocybe cyanescens TaxID=93625 RepID=A0A409XHW2_PSICY|nr:hypothetical protein CVT25_007757 [Psilocybe cyanescens]
MLGIQIHALSLNSIQDSKITNINLYTNRAQVTRSYKVNVASGQTKLTISCLPNVVDYGSLRVEGRGPAVIQDVTVYTVPIERPDSSSPLLKELDNKKEKMNNVLKRCRKALEAIDKYMNNISIESLDISKLGEAMDIYDTTEQKWDERIIDIKKEMENIDSQIIQETERLEKLVENKKLRTNVAMGLFTESPAEVEIILIYAVSNAYWHAVYDIRVDMQTPGTPVQVIYKAAINQRTGEIWENAPVTLETSQPTFGLELPDLQPWYITYEKPVVRRHMQTQRRTTGGKAPRRQLTTLADRDEDEDEDDNEDDMDIDVAEVTSKGDISATFRVPGLTTIPSDEEEHGVTIAVLQLDAKILWACIPKGDTQVHLEANITNSSEYTFLPGPSNVYVDQSFISRSKIPGVAPLETFTCPLGVDPSIRVTYHPQEKMTSESGFYNKSLKYVYSQRISVHNTKSVAVDKLKIIDKVPVSQDANLIVNLINPTLTLPAPSAVGIATSNKALPTVKVGHGILAQWNGAEKSGADVSALGKDGKLNWICSVPALEKINLLLQWEVVDSQRRQIYGL